MRVCKTANLALRFLLECACVASVAVWGLSLQGPDSLRYFTAFALSAIVIMTWASFGSPKAPLRLGPGGRIRLEIALCGIAVLALASSGNILAALALGAVEAVSTAFYHWE